MPRSPKRVREQRCTLCCTERLRTRIGAFGRGGRARYRDGRWAGGGRHSSARALPAAHARCRRGGASEHAYCDEMVMAQLFARERASWEPQRPGARHAAPATHCGCFWPALHGKPIGSCTVRSLLKHIGEQLPTCAVRSSMARDLATFPVGASWLQCRAARLAAARGGAGARCRPRLPAAARTGQAGVLAARVQDL